jgi:hypothetical protein
VRPLVITTTVQVDDALDQVRARLADAVVELTRRPLETARDIEVLASSLDSVRVRVAGDETRGTVECHLRPGDEPQSTIIDVQAQFDELPARARWGAAMPGGRSLVRRVLGGVVNDVLAAQPKTPSVPPEVLHHDPTCPAIQEAGVAAALRRSTRMLVLGAGAAIVLVAMSVAAFRTMDAFGSELERTGERLPAMITSVGAEGDDDEFWVTAEAVEAGREVVLDTYAEQDYRLGQEVVLLHDPATGRSMLEGESYLHDTLDLVGGVSAMAAVLTALVVAWYTAARLRTGRILRSTPFEVADVASVPVFHRGTMLLLVSCADGADTEVVRTTRQMSRRAERGVDALAPRCLVARAGHRAVLWRSDLDRLVVVHTSRSAFRNRRWERAAGIR